MFVAVAALSGIAQTGCQRKPKTRRRRNPWLPDAMAWKDLLALARQEWSQQLARRGAGGSTSQPTVMMSPGI